MRLNIWRATSSKFSNSIFSKTFFSFFFLDEKNVFYIFLLTFTCRIICWISRYLIWKFFKINFVWKWSVKRENYYFDIFRLFLHVGSSSGAVLNVISFVNYFSIFHIIMKMLSMFKIKLFSKILIQRILHFNYIYHDSNSHNELNSNFVSSILS